MMIAAYTEFDDVIPFNPADDWPVPALALLTVLLLLVIHRYLSPRISQLRLRKSAPEAELPVENNSVDLSG